MLVHGVVVIVCMILDYSDSLNCSHFLKVEIFIVYLLAFTFFLDTYIDYFIFI